MTKQKSTTAAGAERRRRAQGRHHATLQASMEAIDPAVAAWSNDFVFGTAWADDDVAWADRMLVAITALAVQGHHAQLRNYLHGALQDGIEEARIRQALRMLTVYAGFPVAIQALHVLGQVVEAEARRT